MPDCFEAIFEPDDGKRRFRLENVDLDKREILNNFSSGFQNFLYRKKWKSADVAKKFNLTHGAVSSWKNGKGFPDFITLLKLFCAGMTLNEVFGDVLGACFFENSAGDYRERNGRKESEKKIVTVEDLEKLKKELLNGLLSSIDKVPK